MFSYISRNLRFWKLKKEADSRAEGEEPQPRDPEVFSGGLEKNLKTLEGLISPSGDVVIRRFIFGGAREAAAAILYIDGLADKTLVNENILKPLMCGALYSAPGAEPDPADLQAAKSRLLFVGDVKETARIDEALDAFLSGDTVLLVDGAKEALLLSLKGWKTRGIEEPRTESVVRGPREGFTETLRINTSLLRRKLKNPRLTFEKMTIGARTKTDVVIAYIDGLVKPEIIDEVKRRLKRIKTDAILESGYIEQFIEDAPYSIFPTIGNSEKPDKVAAKMLEGRAAILVDGTPFVLTVPMLFVEGFQAAEDYYSRPYFASLVRLLRYLSFVLAILAPAIYVALSSFHQELIPTPLLLTMAAAHEGVPFPAVLEAGLMVVVFEILREAGVRLPRPVGQAVSIVGALVIGEAAVSAGLIGAPMVIVVATTAVASFVVPSLTDAQVIMRLALMILAGFMGGYGIAIGTIGFFVYMASLRSFGTPYLSSIAPFNPGDMKDVFIRAPLWKMIRRPKDIAWKDKQREAYGLEPGPRPENTEGGEV